MIDRCGNSGFKQVIFIADLKTCDFSVSNMVAEENGAAMGSQNWQFPHLEPATLHGSGVLPPIIRIGEVI